MIKCVVISCFPGYAVTVRLLYPLAGRIPKLYEFVFLENSSKTDSVKIIEQVQVKWPMLIGHFRLPPHTRTSIRAMPDYTPETACLEVIQQWLEGGDDLLGPKDWDTVITVIRRIGYAKLAEDINRILVGPGGEAMAVLHMYMYLHPKVHREVTQCKVTTMPEMFKWQKLHEWQ